MVYVFKIKQFSIVSAVNLISLVIMKKQKKKIIEIAIDFVFILIGY